MDHLFAGALRVNVALEILKRPAHEARAILILIYSSDNVSGDGEPWVITRPLSRMGHGSYFRETVARLIREGHVDREGTTLKVYASRLVAPATVAIATGVVGIATPVVAPPTEPVAPPTACNKDVRDVEDRGTEDRLSRGSTNPSFPRPKKKSAKRAVADSEYARTVDVWHHLYLDGTGEKYPFDKLDGSKIKALLKTFGEAGSTSRMRTCWKKRTPAYLFRDGLFPDIKSFAAAAKTIIPNAVDGAASRRIAAEMREVEERQAKLAEQRRARTLFDQERDR